MPGGQQVSARLQEFASTHISSRREELCGNFCFVQHLLHLILCVARRLMEGGRSSWGPKSKCGCRYLRAIVVDDQLRGLHFALKNMRLMYLTREAVNKERVRCALLHGFPQQLHCDVCGHQLAFLHDAFYLLSELRTLLHLQPEGNPEPEK